MSIAIGATPASRRARLGARILKLLTHKVCRCDEDDAAAAAVSLVQLHGCCSLAVEASASTEVLKLCSSCFSTLRNGFSALATVP